MASGAEGTAGSGGAQCSEFLPHWQLVIRRGWRLEAGCFKDRRWDNVTFVSAARSPSQVWHTSMEFGMGTVVRV